MMRTTTPWSPGLQRPTVSRLAATLLVLALLMTALVAAPSASDAQERGPRIDVKTEQSRTTRELGKTDTAEKIDKGNPDEGNPDKTAKPLAFVGAGSTLVQLDIDVALEGAFVAGQNMRTDLFAAGLLPTDDPFGLDATLPGTIPLNSGDHPVDWIEMEIRAEDERTVVANVAAIVQADGDVTAPNGQPLSIELDTTEAYHVALFHRSHLPVMSFPVAPAGNTLAYDFTSAALGPLFGAHQVQPEPTASSEWAMIGGNANQTSWTATRSIDGDDKVEASKASGTGVYSAADYNLDGTVTAPVFVWNGPTTGTYLPGPDASIWVARNGNFVDFPAKHTVVINELKTKDDPIADWVEFYNPASREVSLDGWRIQDNNQSNVYIFSGTVIPPQSYYTFYLQNIDWGLGEYDEVTLFDLDGNVVDGTAWESHPLPSLGRCDNHTGSFRVTPSIATPNAPNICSVVTNVDQTVTDMSGLDYEASGTTSPGVLWATRNSPGELFRLVPSATGGWKADAANGWSSGKTLLYPQASGVTGTADAEGVTLADTNEFAYVASERVDGTIIARNSILRYDLSEATNDLNAEREWLLPALDAQMDVANEGNKGIEAITWIPEDALPAGYLPSSPDRIPGLFLVGVEQTATIYAYQLLTTGPATNSDAVLIDTVASTTIGLNAIMALEYDEALDVVWVVCDNNCNNDSVVLSLDGGGNFNVVSLTSPDAPFPSMNGEGFAVGAALECSNNVRPVYWAEDRDAGSWLWEGTLDC